MSDFRYLDYEGLATYTEHVKDYADGKIVYISDESEIPDPPKEGTLYVIGSEILMDEEIIMGTQTSSTSNWTGKSIDTRLHNGKRIAYYLPYPSVGGTSPTLTLELSDEDNTITPANVIVSEGLRVRQIIPGGSVIRMTYFEGIIMNGATRSGWVCDGNIIQNNVIYTGTPVDEQVATFEGTTGTIKASGYTIASSVPANARFDEYEVTVSHAGEAQAIPPRESSGFIINMTIDSAPYKGMKLKINMNDTSSLGTRYVQVFMINVNGINYYRINPYNPSYSFVRNDATFEIEFITDTQWEFTNSRTNYPSDYVIADNSQMALPLPIMKFSFDTNYMPIITNYMEFNVKFTNSVNLAGAQYAETIVPINGSSLAVNNLGSSYGIDNTKVYRLKIDGNKILFCSDEDTNTTYSEATTTKGGLMSASDKSKLNKLNYTTYCICTTGSGTPAKTAAATGFVLATGSVAYVSFSNTNTVINPTLNIGGTGGKYIKLNGKVYNNPDHTKRLSWNANGVYQFVYDGSYWVVVGDMPIANAPVS